MRNLKKFLALVLAMMMVLSMTVTVNAADINDADDISIRYLQAVNVMLELGVFQGDDNGDLRPTENLSRQEFAVLLYRIKTGDTSDVREKGTPAIIQAYAEADSFFTDVTAENSYRGYINYAFEEGLMKGDLDRKLFRPTDTVSGYEILTTYLRMLGYDQRGEYTGNTAWKSNVRIDALSAKITDGSEPNLDNPASREFMGQLSYNQVMYAKVVHFNPLLNSYDNPFGNSSVTWGKVAFNLTEKDRAGDDAYGRDMGVNWTTNVNGEVHSFTAPDLTLVAVLNSKNKTMPSGYEATSSAVAFVDGREDATLDSVIKNVAGTSTKGIYSKVWLGSKGASASDGSLCLDTSNASAGNLIDWLTAKDNWNTEVYANEENQIVRIVVLKTDVHVLQTSDIKAASSTRGAYLKLNDGVEYDCEDGQTFAKGDVVTYVKGWNADASKAIALDAEAVEPTVATPTLKTGSNASSAKYTVNGTVYSLSKAVTAHSNYVTNLDGVLETAIKNEKECNVYILEPAGTLLYAAEIESSGDTDVDDTGYILINAYGNTKEVPGGAITANGTNTQYTVDVYGILSNGDYGTYTAMVKEQWTQNTGTHFGLYSYTYNADKDWLELKKEATGASLGSITEVTTGTVIDNKSSDVQVSPSQVANGKAILTSNTVFVFYQISKNNRTFSSLTPITGVRNLDRQVKVNSIIGVDKETGEALVVYVNEKYTPAGADSGLMIYITKGDTQITAAGQNTAYLIEGIDNLGNEYDNIIHSTTVTEGSVFKLNDDMTLGEEVTTINGVLSNFDKEDGAWIQLKDATTLELPASVDPVALAEGIDALEEGQNLIVVKNANSAVVDAMWVKAIEYAKMSCEVTPDNVTSASITLANGDEASSSEARIKKGAGVKNVLTVTLEATGDLQNATWELVATSSSVSNIKVSDPQYISSAATKITFTVTVTGVTSDFTLKIELKEKKA